jgi:hypothetical protein
MCLTEVCVLLQFKQTSDAVGKALAGRRTFIYVAVKVYTVNTVTSTLMSVLPASAFTINGTDLRRTV